MAGVWVELLLVLTCTLLLDSVLGWERIDGAQLIRIYEAGQQGEAGQMGESFITSYSETSDNEPLPEDVIPDMDSDNNEPPTEDFIPDMDSNDKDDSVIPDTDNGVDEADFSEANWPDSFEEGFSMEFEDAPPRAWTSETRQSSPELSVVCSNVAFYITLPGGPLKDMKVLGNQDLVSITDAPESCDYEVDSLSRSLTVPFTGCNVKHSCKTGSFSLQLLYVDESGQMRVATASCQDRDEKSGLHPRASGSQCPGQPTDSKAQNCVVATEEQVPCGQSGMSTADCQKMGCCVDSSTSKCYYPLDECTGDQHFVFAIRPNSASIPVNPTKLVIPKDTSCKPVIVNDKVAIFKFKVTECGTRSFEVGDTKIYLAEVQSIVKALNLKYGIVTRQEPLRFMVECRYSKTGEPKQSMSSVGYMVKTPVPILPSSVSANALYGVTLRIAKDSSYSSYYPLYHQPLQKLLGNPVYLELKLKSPKPDAVILVNYCLAYPRSAKNALVLVYEGCANPNDPNVSILQVSGLPQNRYQRRFVTKAFQFMDQKTNKYLDEEIYFMCSTEVCRKTEKTCVERCFDGKKP